MKVKHLRYLQLALCQIFLKKLRFINGLELALASRSYTDYKNLLRDSQVIPALGDSDSGGRLGALIRTIMSLRVKSKVVKEMMR